MERKIKSIGLLVFLVSIFILSAYADTEAQQPTQPEVTAVSSKSLTLDKLKARRAAIEKAQNINAALKADSLRYLDQAIVDLNLAADFNNKTKELSQFIKAAPERLEFLRVELKKPFPSIETIKKQAQQLDISTLEQERNQEEAALAKEKTRLREWNDRLTSEKNNISQVSERMVAATSRLNDIQIELLSITDASEDDIGNYSRMLSLRSEKEKLRAENKLNELRQQSHNLLVELFSMERDVTLKTVESRSAKLTVLWVEVQKHRQQDAIQAGQDAKEAMGLTHTLPKMIEDQFAINIQMSAELEEIILEEADLTRKYENYISQLNALEADFNTAKRRFELTMLTEAMGVVMRKKRLNLPAAEKLLANSRAREIRMSQINEKQIALEENLRELSSPTALVQRLADSVSFLSDVDRQSFDLKVQELIASRIEIVEKLKFGYNRIFKLLQDIEFTIQTIVNTAENFGELLDRHLLWIRSSKRLDTTDLLKLGPAIRWFLGPGAWHQLIQDLRESLRQNGVFWIVAFIIALTLLFTRRRESRQLKDIHSRVQQHPLQDSIYLTIKALGLTVLLAIAWPFIMAAPALILLKLDQIEPHTRAITDGLFAVSRTLFVLGFVYFICRKNGLAQVHFRWAEAARKTLHRNLSWFIPIIAVFTFFVYGMDSVPDIEYGETLAKFALIMIAAADAVFIARILRIKGGITSTLIQKHPKSWLTRLRYVWYPLLIALPLLILYLTVQGYYYSALEIEQLTSLTIWLVFGLIVLNDLVLRLLMLTRRKIALEKARIARQLLEEKTAEPDSEIPSESIETDPASLMEIDMGAIDEQTRTLLKTAIFILCLFGLWAIWAPVFPALGILQSIKLWSYTSVVDGVSQLHAITLADVAMAAIIIAITIIAVRNLPGLFEMILLNRLPLDPGARYAYAMVSRYALTALGIVITLNAVGIRWSSLQWLIAALGVGIGFGLQEIVANFICGLIILFERPVRVGDVITIGNTDGVVTKIRIRATTIRGWDRKELLVPNKEFITGRLLNWSLSDQTTRVLITVGVAYGSDVDKALELMVEAAEEHELVLSDPEPFASFDTFGDNALALTLRAYLASTDFRVATTTDLNKAINRKFADAGIEISFPQRDVHMDAKRPLEVRVVQDITESKAAKTAPETQKDPDAE